MPRFKVIGVLSLALALPALGQEIEAVSPVRALEMVKTPGTYLVDVRSVAEYVLIGHPEMAYNVPLTFWSEDEARFVVNPDFLKDLAARFKKQDTLVFICRSGNRSLEAAQMAQRAGYARVYNLGEGFEGELDEKGYRTVGGWKNSLPYTYRFDPKLAYGKPARAPEKRCAFQL